MLHHTRIRFAEDVVVLFLTQKDVRLESNLVERVGASSDVCKQKGRPAEGADQQAGEDPVARLANLREIIGGIQAYRMCQASATVRSHWATNEELARTPVVAEMALPRRPLADRRFQRAKNARDAASSNRGSPVSRERTANSRTRDYNPIERTEPVSMMMATDRARSQRNSHLHLPCTYLASPGTPTLSEGSPGRTRAEDQC